MATIISRYWVPMVFIWSSGWGPRRRQSACRRGYGYGPAGGLRAPPGYARGNDNCLRDLLFLNTGCCLANAHRLRDGIEMVLPRPTTARGEVRRRARAAAGCAGTRLADRMMAAVSRLPAAGEPDRRAPCCHGRAHLLRRTRGGLERHGRPGGALADGAPAGTCRPGAVGGGRSGARLTPDKSVRVRGR